MTNAPLPSPDPRNVQGMILRGYTHPYSCHLLYTFTDAAGFTGTPGPAGFIAALLPFVQSAEDWGANKPARMLNIGLTYNGIKQFEPTLAGQFPDEFRVGPWSQGSQGSLADTGPSDPSLWWNGQDKTAIHCIVHIYGMTADALDGLVAFVSGAAQSNGVREFLPLKGGGRLEEYAPLKDFIHFGYHDGIDNPGLGSGSTDSGDANNFLIGYPGSAFSPGPTQGAAGQFAKDGCYNAFRILYQDVGAFDQFLTDNAPAVVVAIGGTLDQAKEWLAAKLVGRWRNGSPLILSPDAPDPCTSDATGFGYSADTAGLRCPFSAHSRVANPRDEGTFPADTPVPRILRRGMPYGAPPVPPDYDGERGLIGLFLCGSLAGEFELLYSWINTNNFSNVFAPNFDTQDALIANRVSQPNGDPSFTMPLPNGASIKIPSMPQFLVTRGTAYCLLPSMTTLQNLAGAVA